MRFLAFPFGVKIVDKPQVWCASKSNTVDKNNPQPQSLRVLYDTLLYTTASGNNGSTSNALLENF